MEPTQHMLEAYGTALSIGSSRASTVSVLSLGVVSSLPAPVKTAIEKWNNNSGNEFPSIGAWVSQLKKSVVFFNLID